MPEWTATSPDGANELTVILDGTGRLRYEVYRLGDPIVSGRMGLVRRDVDFSAALEVMAIGQPETVDVPYSMVHGKRSEGALRATLQLLSLRSAVSGARLDLVVGAADEGVAFRYRFPGENPSQLEVTDEVTTFVLPADGRAWLQPAQTPGYAQPAYENLYLNAVPIDHQTDAPSYNMPALFGTPAGWALLAEADLAATYVGGHLSNTGTGTTYRVVFPQEGEGNGYGAVAPVHDLPWTMPWRVIVLGETAAEVASADLVNALAHPAQGDYSWVRPGRVSWSWWSEHDSPQDLGRLRAYVDLAAQLGWEYTLIDANWNVHSDASIAELVRYAADRGVGVFLWYNSGGPHNTVTEQPRDRMFDPVRRRTEMERLVEWGVVGMKIDFFHSDKQAGIQLYLDIARDAADHRLMVNFHGSTVPRGWSRSWPHIMTMEGVAGAEQYAFRPDYPEAAPWHNTILPFTRNAIGPMDYTPVTFSDQVFPHVTTNAHELALAVVFESGLQHFADSEASLRWCPDPVRAVLAAVPAAWDETIVLDGVPGEYVVVARRKGDEWFVAAISGKDEPLRLLIGLHMLDRPALAHVVHDGPTPREFSFETYSVTPVDTHEAVLASHGGIVMWLAPT